MANLGSASADGQIVYTANSREDIFESERNGRLMQMMRSMSDQSLPLTWMLGMVIQSAEIMQDMFSDPR